MRRFLGLLALAACGDGLRGERLVAVAVIGTEGGTIEGEGIALDVPPGALGRSTTIKISTTETPLDENYVALSPVFHFEPDGLEFAMPVAVRMAAPEADSGVVLWTTKSGETFEFAGYVTAGVGYGEITHFSKGVAADEFAACDSDTSTCVGGACAGLDDKCTGDTCSADTGPACTVEQSPLEACRDICWCDSNDRFDHMCASNPGDPRIGCPATNAAIGKILANGSFERDAQGNEFLARRNGDACTGYSIRPQVSPSCFCIANAGPPANGANLCPNGRWVNKATPPNFNWACVSDIEGKAPSLRNGLLFEDLATKSFTGTNGGACTGQYINNNTPQTASGTLQSCVDTNVAHGYYQLPGTAASCGAFGWPNGNTPATVSIDRATCRLSAADAAELARGRIVAKLRPRKDMPDDGATFALLKADMRTIPGINYTDRANVIIPECAGQGTFTARHAEGDALESLALLRGVTPVTEPPFGSTGGIMRGGSARLLVDRAPCEKNCAAYGIDRMRKCAALDELVVESPSGTVKYCDTCGAKGQKQ